MSTREIDLRVRLDARSAESDSRRLGSAFEDTGRKARRLGAATDEAGGAFERFKTHTRRLNDALGALGLAFGAREVVRFGVDLVRTAVEAEAVWNRLGGQLAAVGVDFGLVREEIQAAARELQNFTTVGDEDFAAVLQRLVSITGDYRRSLDHVALVADVAAGAHVDLDTAATLVGRTLIGDASLLRRYGIVVQEGADAIQAMRDRFHGLAQNEARELEGRLKQLSNEWGDFKEAVGLALIGASDMEDAVAELTGRLRELNAEVEESRPFIAAAREGFGLLTGDMTAFADAVAAAREEHRRLREEQEQARRSPLLEDELRHDLVTAADFPFMGPSPEDIQRIQQEQAAEAARAMREAARAQAEHIRLFERARELGLAQLEDFRTILAVEREITTALRTGNASLEERVRLADDLARIHDSLGVLGPLERPGVQDTTADLRQPPIPSIDGIAVGRQIAAGMDPPGIGERIAEAMEGPLGGVVAGLATTVAAQLGERAGGPLAGQVASGAVSGAFATGTPFGAILGAVGGLVGGLLSLGDDAEEAARRMREAQEAFARSLDAAIASVEAGTGTFAARVFQLAEDMRREAERFAQAFGDALFQREFQQDDFRGGAGVPLETVFEDLLAPEALDSLEAIRAARAQLEEWIPSSERAREEFERLLELFDAWIEQLEEARAAAQLALQQDLEVRALQAQGLTAEASARRQQIEQERERQEALEQEFDAATLAQLEYVHELERAALAAEQAAQAERDRLSFFERMAELSGDDLGAARIRAEIQAAEDIRNAEALLAQGLISAEHFAQFLELVTGSVNEAVEDLQRNRERQAEAFEADVAARFAEVTGDEAEADRIRREIAAGEELDRARELVEAGIITEEMFAALADVLELELAKAAEEAAEAAQRAADAQRQAMEDLEVRRLAALGQDSAAEALRFQLEQQRELERAILEGASEEFIRQLEEVQRLEREAFERAARGAGRATAASAAAAANEGADTVARNIQAITTDQAITIVHILRTHTGHLSEIAQNTRPLRGGAAGAGTGAVVQPARGAPTFQFHVHGVQDPRQFAERFIVLLRTDPRLRQAFDAAQAIPFAEAAEFAGITGRGG